MNPANPDPSLGLRTALWLVAAGLWIAGGAVWFRPPPEGPARSTPEDAVPEQDVAEVVAFPPVPGRVEAAALQTSIRRGVEAFLQQYIDPSYAGAAAGGFLDLARPDGSIERRGPDVYAQCQLYLLIHLLLYREEFGLEESDPRVQEVYRWFRDTQDEDGRWLWSDEGCIHAKSMIILAQRGERERFDRAWDWARQSRLYLPESGLFTTMRSGYIVQTLGDAAMSLSDRLDWEHSGPEEDEENSAKYLYALLAMGRGREDAEVRRMAQEVSRLIATSTIPIGRMQTHQVLGRAWYVLCHTRFDLPPDDGYRMSLAVLRAALQGEWRRNFLMRAVPLARALMIRALLEAGDRGPEIDAIAHGFVRGQDEDGAWKVPHTYAVWGLDRPPAQGYKYGNMDGANTYLTALGLISYREFGQP